MSWVLLTGEYPPQRGGVADYTALLARALRAAGDVVHVVAPPCDQPDDVDDDGITVHRLPDVYGLRSRAMLSRLLAGIAPPRATLVQYVAQSFGLRGCNIPFTRWLGRLSGYPLFMTFHEVTVTVRADTPLKYRLQALATRVMAGHVARAADASFVSTPVWEPLLRHLGARRGPIEWTPVPSNVALSATVGGTAAVRARFAAPGDVLLGHFGTFREAFTRRTLAATIVRTLREPQRSMLLIGRGSDHFAQQVIAEHPLVAGRLFGMGGLQPQDLADHLAACDLLVQPFEDGVTTRRGSVTAALALGRAIATSAGPLTEDLWSSSGAVGLAQAASDEDFASLVERLAREPQTRATLGRRARALYADRFAIEHTVAALRRQAGRPLAEAV